MAARMSSSDQIFCVQVSLLLASPATAQNEVAKQNEEINAFNAGSIFRKHAQVFINILVNRALRNLNK